MTTAYSRPGNAVLIIAHIMGMIDLVSLPIWVGTLMQHYYYEPRQAGLLVTLFLISVALSSLYFAPRFNRLPHRFTATAGFAVAAFAFAFAAQQSIDSHAFATLALLHGSAGFGIGCGLSFTHGKIGRCANPHRLFAMAGMALGVFALTFVGIAPPLIQAFGPSTLFIVFAVLMAIAAMAIFAGFPEDQNSARDVHLNVSSRIPRAAWYPILIVVCMTLNQSTVYAFMERIGITRGFGVGHVNGVLIAIGLLNLLPAMLAALLQSRLQTRRVALIAVMVQAGLALLITNSTSFVIYAAASSVFIFVMIFTHTFLFGFIARKDTSGRAVAATPAMMMLGASLGPVVGGVIVQASGYAGLGWASVLIALIALVCVSKIRNDVVDDPAVSLQPV